MKKCNTPRHSQKNLGTLHRSRHAMKVQISGEATEMFTSPIPITQQEDIATAPDVPPCKGFSISMQCNWERCRLQRRLQRKNAEGIGWQQDRSPSATVPPPIQTTLWPWPQVSPWAPARCNWEERGIHHFGGLLAPPNPWDPKLPLPKLLPPLPPLFPPPFPPPLPLPPPFPPKRPPPLRPPAERASSPNSCGMGWPTFCMVSITSRACFPSFTSRKVTAIPGTPARPVRPIR
mmetsp:Transcript_16918/g.39775  ORF Transcript_16918/g.39775 Transcript_16918/m.39775 type:complete len:233 (+) Transcript_16918:56-754(+)